MQTINYHLHADNISEVFDSFARTTHDALVTTATAAASSGQRLREEATCGRQREPSPYVVVMSNNHSLDYGRQALDEETFAALDKYVASLLSSGLKRGPSMREVVLPLRAVEPEVLTLHALPFVSPATQLARQRTHGRHRQDAGRGCASGEAEARCMCAVWAISTRAKGVSSSCCWHSASDLAVPPLLQTSSFIASNEHKGTNKSAREPSRCVFSSRPSAPPVVADGPARVGVCILGSLLRHTRGMGCHGQEVCTTLAMFWRGTHSVDPIICT